MTYFAAGILVALPLGFIYALTPADPGEPKLAPMFFMLLPFLYGLAALVFVPIGCWIYNRAASMVGGIEFIVEDKADA